MNAATLARCIEPFFTTKPPGKGTGLGLPMARGFAEQSGGALTVRSAPGKGTTVTLWLPEATKSRKRARIEGRFNPLNLPAPAYSLSTTIRWCAACSSRRCQTWVTGSPRLPTAWPLWNALTRLAARPDCHRLRHARHERPSSDRGGATRLPSAPCGSTHRLRRR